MAEARPLQPQRPDNPYLRPVRPRKQDDGVQVATMMRQLILLEGRNSMGCQSQ